MRLEAGANKPPVGTVTPVTAQLTTHVSTTRAAAPLSSAITDKRHSAARPRYHLYSGSSSSTCLSNCSHAAAWPCCQLYSGSRSTILSSRRQVSPRSPSTALSRLRRQRPLYTLIAFSAYSWSDIFPSHLSNQERAESGQGGEASRVLNPVQAGQVISSHA